MNVILNETSELNIRMGSEQAAELFLSPLFNLMHDLLAFPGPGSMPLWMPLLDISMAMAVHARVTACSHLSFVASAPRSEKVHHDLDTNARGSSDPHTAPNPSTWELPLTWLTATEPEFDQCILYKLHITLRRLWHATLSEECSPVTYLRSCSAKKWLACLPSFLPS